MASLWPRASPPPIATTSPSSFRWLIPSPPYGGAWDAPGVGPERSTATEPTARALTEGPCGAGTSVPSWPASGPDMGVAWGFIDGRLSGRSRGSANSEDSGSDSTGRRNFTRPFSAWDAPSFPGECSVDQSALPAGNDLQSRTGSAHCSHRYSRGCLYERRSKGICFRAQVGLISRSRLPGQVRSSGSFLPRHSGRSLLNWASPATVVPLLPLSSMVIVSGMGVPLGKSADTREVVAPTLQRLRGGDCNRMLLTRMKPRVKLG